MLKFIILDWDGTLNNSMESIYKTYAAHSGKSVDYIREHFDPDWKSFIKKEKIPDMTFEKWQRLMESFGTEFFPGAAACIRKLKNDGFVLAIASASPLESIKKRLAEEGLSDAFPVIVSAEMVKELKPDPECLIMTMEKLNAKVKECVFIGDSCADAVAANRIGMRFIGVDWGFQCAYDMEEAESIRIVKDFDELYDTIKSL